MGPEDLVQVLAALPPLKDPAFLAGARDDATVYRLSPDRALIFTLDFITPVVNNPYTFGQIAAANALSDVYAMGGEPFLAMNILAFPVRGLPLHNAQDILRGGADKAAEAGVAVVGGHSVDDLVPKYGMAVAGFVHPERVVTRAGARPGDALVLTKPIGLGVMTTALDLALAGPDLEDRVAGLLAGLNKGAAAVMTAHGVRGGIDVSGYGLLGHLHEMASQSGVAARVFTGRMPVLPEAWDLLAAGAISGGTRNNLRYLEPRVRWDEGIGEAARLLLCDAQTSGGLLMAVPPGEREGVLADLRAAGIAAAEIGEVMEGPAGRIEVWARDGA